MTEATAAPVAVAVVSWNTRELLRRCLRSLAPEQECGRASVWVVDNGSTDGSRELVRSDFPWASLVESDRNLGFGAAVNLVAERAASPWIAPANADIALAPGALAALLEAGAADPRVAAIAPRLVLADGSTQNSVYAFPTLPYTLALNLALQRLVPGLGDRLLFEGRWDTERARRVDWAIGAFQLVRRSAFEAVGGFDERQWIYAEDLDLGWRLARAGFSTRYQPAAIVQHESAAATGPAFGDEVRRRFMAATYAWMLRRRGVGLTRATAAVNVAGAAARVALFTPATAFSPRARSARDDARAWLHAHRVGLASRDTLLAASAPPHND